MTQRAVVVVVAGALVLAACGGNDDAEEVAGPSPTVAAPAGTTPEATPVATPSAAPNGSPIAATKGMTMGCQDPAGDQDAGGSSGDLRSVVLAKNGDELTATFTTAAAPPAAGTVLWTLDMASADQDTVLQFGAKTVDGRQSGHYAFAFEAGQQDLPGTFTVDGPRMVATFPWSRVAALGPGAGWAGRVTLNQDSPDSCPNDGTAEDIKKNRVVKAEKFPAAWFR